jgi:hypothetical protein
LDLIDNDEVHNVLECIKLDNVHFVENTDPSVTWSALVRQFEEYPLLDVSNTNAAADDIVNDLSENFKRIYGALLCTSELLIEFSPRNGPVVVQSLYKALVSPVLFGHSNSTSFILNLVQDYKMYFPYAYTFSRRIGRSPHMTLQQWRDCLFPDMADAEGDAATGPMSTADWDMSGLEEGEDSDGEDQKSINDAVIAARSPQRRRATRMNSSAAAARNTSRTTSPGRATGAGADLLMSSEDSLLEIQDLSFVSGNEDNGQKQLSPAVRNRQEGSRQRLPQGNAGKGANPKQGNSTSRFSSALAGAVSSSDEEGVSNYKKGGKGRSDGRDERREDEISLDELRAIFDQSLGDGSDLAEKRYAMDTDVECIH